MSIRDQIRDCVDGQELVRVTPYLPGAPRIREVFATHDVFRFLNGTVVTGKQQIVKRAADSRAAIDAFISGRIIAVGMDPFDKAPHSQLARNAPPGEGIWDFRIRDPRPHVRIFGGFAEQDVFVALDFRSREELDYDAAVATMKVLWADLFGETSPIVGDDINAYISSAYRLV